MFKFLIFKTFYGILRPKTTSTSKPATVKSIFIGRPTSTTPAPELEEDFDVSHFDQLIKSNEVSF